jgi:manganese/zinc/iron transport system substrate-binding protein
VQDIERLVELIASRGIRAIFVESTVSERNINAIIAGAKARGHTVLVGGSLYSDAMGKPGTWEGTYIGMLEHNVRTITEALGGTVPEGGPRESSQPSTPGDDPH